MQTANIIITCEDRPGIVRAVTDFLFRHGANVSFLEEHAEEGHFFMRIEWETASFLLKTPQDFQAAFNPLEQEFQMTTSLDYNRKKKKIGLFCSREGHCLADILIRNFLEELNIEIPYIISNFDNCEKIARKFKIPFYHIPTNNNTEEYESKMLQIIKENPTDLIGLARFMKVLSTKFIDAVGQKIINVHHSFLPSFIGAKPYEEAYDRGVKLIGATAHYVTPDLDQGPIIEQETKRIKHRHDAKYLKILGREMEKEVFAFAIRKYIENKITIFKKRTIVFE